ncbi:MAG: NAD-dependent epimerase/dehydratase family protein [Polyangiaceae bacterium]|nr:NAD-dependent epimerase/dehydratase family protein [Polyangiaceae bacterium]
MKRMVVTGSSGFVGSHLTRGLAERGDEVIALDVAAPRKPFESERVRTMQGDLRDLDTLKRAVEGADTVFHVASRVQTRGHGADEVFAINVGGTRKLIEACKAANVPRFVYVSSASVVYDGKDIERGDERLPYPSHFHAPYAETKAIAEKEVLEENAKGALATCSIRPHVVFGPGDMRFFPAILARAKTGRLKAYVGDASKLSDFTYIDNLVHGLMLAADKLEVKGPLGGQAYFVTNGEPVPFWDFIGRVLDGLGYARPKFRVPYPIAYGAAAVRETIDALTGATPTEDRFSRFTIRYLTTHHYFDHGKATRDFGYAKQVSIDEGIARTLATLKN